MKRHPPHPQMTLTITRELHAQLCMASVHSGFEQEDWEIAALAVTDWLARNAPGTIAMPKTRGYQWKQLFLPDGTVLRTIYQGKNHHCSVDEDNIRYDGKETSPSQFVNKVGGVRRNAWQAVWLLFPNTSEWKLAQSLRPQRAKNKRK